jgi:hypothetical protein
MLQGLAQPEHLFISHNTLSRQKQNIPFDKSGTLI